MHTREQLASWAGKSGVKRTRVHGQIINNLPKTISRSKKMGGTLLYDAIFLASDELMQKQQGGKALILLTDDRGSKTSLASAIESASVPTLLCTAFISKGRSPAISADTAVGRGRWSRGGMGRPRGGGPNGYPQESHEDGKKVLERIAKETFDRHRPRT